MFEKSDIIEKIDDYESYDFFERNKFLKKGEQAIIERSEFKMYNQNAYTIKDDWCFGCLWLNIETHFKLVGRDWKVRYTRRN